MIILIDALLPNTKKKVTKKLTTSNSSEQKNEINESKMTRLYKWNGNLLHHLNHIYMLVSSLTIQKRERERERERERGKQHR